MNITKKITFQKSIKLLKKNKDFMIHCNNNPSINNTIQLIQKLAIININIVANNILDVLYCITKNPSYLEQRLLQLKPLADKLNKSKICKKAKQI